MRLLLSFTLALLLLPACGSKATDGGGATSSQDGAPTAEALFEALNEAAANDDQVAAMQYVVPEQRGMLTFFMGLFAPTMMIGMQEAFAGMGDEANVAKNKKKIEELKKSFGAVLVKHGLDPDFQKLMEPMQDPANEKDPKAGFAALDKLFEGVDHAALMRDGLAWMEANSDKKDEEDGKKAGGPTLKSLHDLQVDGDTATAKVEGKESGVDFVKRDGRWYVDFTKMIMKGK